MGFRLRLALFLVATLAAVQLLTAARKQNDGRAEPASAALTRFVLSVVPKKHRRR